MAPCKVSFNELLWYLYLSNTFYYILVQLDALPGNLSPPPAAAPTPALGDGGKNAPARSPPDSVCIASALFSG